MTFIADVPAKPFAYYLLRCWVEAGHMTGRIQMIDMLCSLLNIKANKGAIFLERYCGVPRGNKKKFKKILGEMKIRVGGLNPLFEVENELTKLLLKWENVQHCILAGSMDGYIYTRKEPGWFQNISLKRIKKWFRDRKLREDKEKEDEYDKFMREEKKRKSGEITGYD